VEYATRDQAQNAVNSLSNQNLMGRLVYVREVRLYSLFERLTVIAHFSSYRTVRQSLASAAVAKAAAAAACVADSKEAPCVVVSTAASIPWAAVVALV